MPKVVDHEERRAELAGAVWRLVMREGIDAASVRRVAAEAGWSAGSLRHYFETRSELLRFAMELVVQRVTERVQALGEDAEPRALLHQVLPLDDEHRAEMQVWLAFTMQALVDPDLGELRDAAHSALRDLAPARWGRRAPRRSRCTHWSTASRCTPCWRRPSPPPRARSSCSTPTSAASADGRRRRSSPAAASASNAARTAGHSPSTIENQAVSRLRPLTIMCWRNTPSNVKPKRSAARRERALAASHFHSSRR